MTIVSNSDIETFQKCPRMFYYSRIMNIRLQEMPVFIQRGSFGHKCAEVGFEIMMNGGSAQEASQAAAGVLNDMMNSGNPLAGDIIGVYRHVTAFFYFVEQQAPWRPVATEDRGMWNISRNEAMPSDNDDWQDSPEYALDRIFGYTPDLVVEFTKGAFRGQYGVLDYKFLSNYMKEIALEMSQQIPKYIIYRQKQHSDTSIRHGAFVQFNTRATPQDSGSKLFLVKWLDDSMTKAKMSQVEYENEIWVDRIADIREDLNYEYLRTVNKDVCERCFFAEVCKAEFNGKPVDRILEQRYMENDYGYTATKSKAS